MRRVVVLALAACQTGSTTSADPAFHGKLLHLQKAYKQCATELGNVADAARPDARAGILYDAACCAAQAGSADAAFAMLDRAIAAGWHRVAWLRDDDELASLHADARWQRLLDTATAAEDRAGQALGAPALRKQLIAMMVRDQQVRDAIGDGGDGSDAEAAMTRMLAIDTADTAQLARIIAANGWPGRALVGDDGASAAWLIAQHTPDHALMRLCLVLMTAAVAAGDASAKELAYLYDRVAMMDDRPQLYGTQFKGTSLYPVEDEANVDARRAAIGLPTMAEYRAGMAALYGPDFQ
jgi:hypothetical protein